VRMESQPARGRFVDARSARLASADLHGQPHLVPIVFAVIGETIYTAVDGKPKSSRLLRRLDNIAANPRVSLLVDQYSDDWAQLWWARADGRARVLDSSDPAVPSALAHLTARYPQYRVDPPPGPVIAIEVERWSGWSFSA
jgi:PPOX class probable F420-dependent enzyme